MLGLRVNFCVRHERVTVSTGPGGVMAGTRGVCEAQEWEAMAQHASRTLYYTI